jgi:WD40 repeat protein
MFVNKAEKEKLWQHPVINLFKWLQIDQIPTGKIVNNNNKINDMLVEGNVERVIDRQIGKVVFLITGVIPAANFVQIPRNISTCLGLEGIYLYLNARIIPSRYWGIHFDLLSMQRNVIRISFGNIYSDLKINNNNRHVMIPCGFFSEKWFVLKINLDNMLRQYTNEIYHSVKSIQFCANTVIRNVYTSDESYNCLEIPRDMQYPLAEGQHWLTVYDWHNFPALLLNNNNNNNNNFTPRAHNVSKYDDFNSNNANNNYNNNSPIPKTPPSGEEMAQLSPSPTKVKSLVVDSKKYTDPSGKSFSSSTSTSLSLTSSTMEIESVIGVNCEIPRLIAWSHEYKKLFFCSGSSIIAQTINNNNNTKQQHILLGHTDIICCLAINTTSSLMASAQMTSISSVNNVAIVRIWDLSRLDVTAIVCPFENHHNHHNHNNNNNNNNNNFTCYPISLDFSVADRIVIVSNGPMTKQQIVIVDLSRCLSDKIPESDEDSGSYNTEFSTITEHSILVMKYIPFSNSQLVSCGNKSIRFWRTKGDSLRSRSITFRDDYNNYNFTDIGFDIGIGGLRVLISTKEGAVFQVGYDACILEAVFQLHVGPINSISVNRGTCVTGGEDKFLRLWPLDFSEFLFEAEHQKSVIASTISNDGTCIFALSSAGTVGVLDISLQQYKTIHRSHRGDVRCVAMDPSHLKFATGSVDGSIRIWNLKTNEEVLECGIGADVVIHCICFHPHESMIATGFSDGGIKIFDISQASLKFEIFQHVGPVSDIIFTLDGKYLISCGANDGTLLVFDCNHAFQAIKMFPNIAACSCLTKNLPFVQGPHLRVSSDGKYIGFIDQSSKGIVLLETLTLQRVNNNNNSNNNNNESSSYGKFNKQGITTFSFNSMCNTITNTNTNTNTNTKNNKCSIEASTILCTTDEGVMFCFDIKTNRICWQTSCVNFKNSWIRSISLSDDNLECVTSDDQGWIRYWNRLSSSRPFREFKSFVGHRGPVNNAIFTKTNDNNYNDERIISVGMDGNIFIWKIVRTINNNNNNNENNNENNDDNDNDKVEIEQQHRKQRHQEEHEQEDNFKDDDDDNDDEDVEEIKEIE